MELAAEVERAEERSRGFRRPADRGRAAATSARAEYADAVEALERRLVGIYKSDTPDYTSVLLDSDGFDDLSTRADYLQALHDADMRVADRVAALREEVAGTYQEIAELKRDAEAEAASLDATRDDFEATQAEAKQGIATVAPGPIGVPGRPLGGPGSRSPISRRSKPSSRPSRRERRCTKAGPTRSRPYIVMCESGGNYGGLSIRRAERAALTRFFPPPGTPTAAGPCPIRRRPPSRTGSPR